MYEACDCWFPSAYFLSNDIVFLLDTQYYSLSNDEGCLFAGLYELVCCPGGGGSSCDFCTDGVKFPNAVVENNGETITCTEIAIA